MRWSKITFNASRFRPSDLLVTSRGGYELYHNPANGKGWIMSREGFEWFIYGPYDYRHVRQKYNAL